MYVIFEGVDTCGKSTQVEFFAARHNDVIATKEPGGTATGKKLRSILLDGEDKLSFNAELFLFLADRALHYDTVVKEARESSVVISDRGFLSGIAYACANHPKTDKDFLLHLNHFALNECYPEKIVLFITNEALLKERLTCKNQDAIESRGVSYLLLIQAIMRDILEKLSIPYLEVDACLDKESIYRKIEDFIYD
jgi:dTMP kinase